MADSARKAAFEKVGECLYRYVPTGTYYARYKVKGVESRRSLDTTDRALAKRRLADLQRDAARIGGKVNKLTVGELCDLYLATVAQRKPKTIRRNRDIAAAIKRDFPGGPDALVAKVFPSQVKAWLASYDFGPASFNLYLAFVRAAFALAVSDNLLAASPVDGIKGKRPAKPLRKTPTFEEFEAIVAAIRANRFSAEAQDSGDFVEFIGLAGLGQAEACALTWGDIDWRNEQITTFRLKTSRGFPVPLYPQLRPLLERMRQERAGGPPGGEKVFRVLDAKKAISAACKRLGLPGHTHRSFRRMFITRAIEKGVDVKVIAQWQGHQDGGKLILDTYSHVQPKHSNAMAKLMG